MDKTLKILSEPLLKKLKKAWEGDILKLISTLEDISSLSNYFRSAFSNNEWAEKEDVSIFKSIFITIIQIFRFIYCGNIELKKLQGSDVLKLLIAVDELNIQQLVSYIQEYLIEH
ncbi:hypothetical protein RhiirA4_458877 [Rhizophagus irregularis]|uniref:BTB domain-containing protein n=1 Tax=Rhizophagus irregularis TaxID=588596 RepID=A0A2I1GD39_9GLOM|nr:hypothetical protein RhiirA4_458877 [Rhizophagus irregularis]